MKNTLLIILCLGLCLLCLGCSWMDGNYATVTPHIVTPELDPENMVQATNYSQLRNALINLIDAGATNGIISTNDYPQEQLNSDIGMAVSYILQNDPVGAYAVDRISYESGTNSGQNVISVEITYIHGKTEIDQIKTVRGINGATNAIATALRQFSDSLVLQITDYKNTDFAQLVTDYASAHPDIVMEIPLVTAQVYPASGDVRVVELIFQYQTSRDSLRNMQADVRPIFSSASLYVNSDADAYTKFSQLYTFLMERFDYTYETSITPSYSLLLHGVGDSKAFAQVYAAMCQQSGLECMIVSGTCNADSRFWNIIFDGEVYYHVDLLRSVESGGFSLYADEEMYGYVWDYSAYPVCGQYVTADSENGNEQ